MYAIGGSADPTIFSEGNYFIASDKSNSKEVLHPRKSIHTYNSHKHFIRNDIQRVSLLFDLERKKVEKYLCTSRICFMRI